MKNRPFGVTLLAILAGLGALVAIFHTLQFLNFIPFFLGPLRFFTFNLFAAILWGLMALIYLWVGRMLWQVNPQAWLFLLILSTANLILDAVAILGNSTFQALLPSILVNGIILIYLLLPGTKAAFEVD